MKTIKEKNQKSEIRSGSFHFTDLIMVKIKASGNHENVDLEKGIISGVLKQVKYDDTNVSVSKEPRLVSVWCCDIDPKKTKDYIKFMSEKLTPLDEVSLFHIKRFKKVEIENGGAKVVVIRCILCSTQLMNTRQDLIDYIETEFNSPVVIENLNIQCVEVPKELPRTKEIAIDWSYKYWPMAWKGNPNHQFLLTVQLNIDLERKIIQTIINLARDKHSSEPDKLPIVTVIAKISDDELDIEIVAVGYDTRDEHPLQHSIMNAISTIAENELNRRNKVIADSIVDDNREDSYLCHNLLVYTTHEPCVMCSMALVHSRIGKLTYIKNLPNTGSLESKYAIGDRDGLNWKFDIWKWIGAQENDSLNELTDEKVFDKLSC